MEIKDVCFLRTKFMMLFFRICDFWPMKNKENLISAKIAKVAKNKIVLFTNKILYFGQNGDKRYMFSYKKI